MDEAPQPARRTTGVHIPPEEAVAIAFFALEIAAHAWTRRRSSLSLSLLGLRRRFEFAVAHEHGFTMLLRESRFFHRR